MKKLLSTILALSLMIGCCAPCFAHNESVDNAQSITAQEKEIVKIEKDLKKYKEQQLKKLETIKNMSEKEYHLHRLNQILTKISISLTCLGVISATGFIAYQKGRKSSESYGCCYDDGYDQGKRVGHENGYEDGYEKGHSKGHREGYGKGYREGYDKGYDNGYVKAFDKKITNANEKITNVNEKITNVNEKITNVNEKIANLVEETSEE